MSSEIGCLRPKRKTLWPLVKLQLEAKFAISKTASFRIVLVESDDSRGRIKRVRGPQPELEGDFELDAF